jgi:uncharacterized membrane protein
MPMTDTDPLPASSSNSSKRIKAAAWHLLGSVLVAVVSAGFVFGLWYPGPYAVLAGGVGLFLLITSVDVVLGPLLTLVAYDVRKTRSHIRRDLATIALIQLAGLGYGLHTVFVARPVVLAAENQLFRVVVANEVDLSELAAAPEELRQISLTGPVLVGVRSAKNGQERMEFIQRSLEGYDGGARPKLWEPYEQSKQRVIAQLKPLDGLTLSGSAKERVSKAVQQTGLTNEDIGYASVKARATGWIVLVDRSSGKLLDFVSTQ